MNHVKLGALILVGGGVLAAATLAFAASEGGGLGTPTAQTTAVRTPDPAWIASLYNVETSDYQKAILADGTVTEEEIDTAVRATVACLRAQGVDAIPTEKKRLRPTLVHGSGRRLGRRHSQKVAPCKETYMSELGLPHNLELQARYAAFSKEEFHRRFVACLVARGFTLDSPDDSYYGVEFQAHLGPAKQAQNATRKS